MTERSYTDQVLGWAAQHMGQRPVEEWLARMQGEAWESGLNSGIGYAPFMANPDFPEPANPYLDEYGEPR